MNDTQHVKETLSNHWHIYASTEPKEAILAVNADGTVIVHGNEVEQTEDQKQVMKMVFEGFLAPSPSVHHDD